MKYRLSDPALRLYPTHDFDHLYDLLDFVLSLYRIETWIAPIEWETDGDLTGFIFQDAAYAPSDKKLHILPDPRLTQDRPIVIPDNFPIGLSFAVWKNKVYCLLLSLHPAS